MRTLARWPGVIEPPVRPVVPRCWPGGRVVILAGGPSLTAADVNACRDRAHVVAIKDAIRLAPWAEMLYAADRHWWLAHPATRDCPARKYGLEGVPGRTDIEILRMTGEFGLDLDPTALCSGRNSGHQAINLVVHTGVTSIVLLGYDMQADLNGRLHWFGMHPYGGKKPDYPQFQRFLASLVEPLAALGVRIVNCSPGSALTCFPQSSLAEALA